MPAYCPLTWLPTYLPLIRSLLARNHQLFDHSSVCLPTCLLTCYGSTECPHTCPRTCILSTDLATYLPAYRRSFSTRAVANRLVSSDETNLPSSRNMVERTAL
eukprot:6177623-Pleurochrysis_carterae.AAC.2